MPSTKPNANYQLLHSVMERLGYRWDSRPFALNLLGLRDPDRKANTFNDWLLAGMDNGVEQLYRAWPITTDPGVSTRLQPVNPKGTAILAPGQYQNAWCVGLHKGQYEALVQCSPVRVYRDNDRDSVLDMTPSSIDEGVFGINIHRSNPKSESTLVDGWSAGCQVFKKAADFDEFMVAVKLSASKGFHRFSYGLADLERVTALLKA